MVLGTLVLGAWLGLAVSAGAQEPGRPRPAAPPDQEPGRPETKSPPPAEDLGFEPPGELLGPTLDPFSHGPLLHSRRLRGLSGEVASMILRGRPGGGPIAFEAFAAPLRGAGGKARVPFFIEIDGATFLEANQSGSPRVEVYAYALGADEHVAAYLAEAFAVDLDELGERVWQSGLKYYGDLALPAGDYKLRLMVRNTQSKAAALRELAIQVPAFDEPAGPRLLPPIFAPPRDRDRWISVRESDAGKSDEAYPFVTEDQAISPNVLPVLGAGRSSRAHLFAYDLPPGELKGRVELFQGDAAATSAPLRVLRRSRAPAGQPERLGVQFELPEITPGLYSLRIGLPIGGHSVESTPVSVVVLQQKAQDRAFQWTDLRGQISDAAEAVDAAEGAAKKPRGKAVARAEQARRNEERERVLGLASSYREVLVALGEGRFSLARSALLELESRVLTDRTIDSLQTAQLWVAQKLAESEVESLIPIMALHEDLYRVYRRRKLFSLSLSTRAMIETLAELYAKQGGTEGSRVVAARALSSLAGRLQEANMPASSRRLFRRALELDPRNKAALLGLASSHERFGESPQAVEVLRQLVEFYPDFDEGLLRLAVNLGRLGDRLGARDLISQVAELANVRPWVLALAHQELARGLLETGDLKGAARLLEQSLDQIPDPGTACLLAHVYDRLRQPFESLDLLANITPMTHDSARQIYDSWPQEVLDEMRRELAGAADARTALVTTVLANLGGQE